VGRGVLDHIIRADGTDWNRLCVPVRAGRITPGDLVLTVAFGAGMNWGANLLRA
jgi:3-oxoacyl-[acyl-carrier-protein] synthase III